MLFISAVHEFELKADMGLVALTFASLQGLANPNQLLIDEKSPKIKFE
jgi:hypothetical protein